jgi:hypothetical protein
MAIDAAAPLEAILANIGQQLGSPLHENGID